MSAAPSFAAPLRSRRDWDDDARDDASWRLARILATKERRGHFLTGDQRRALDAAEVAEVQEELADLVPVCCRNSRLFLGKEKIDTGARSYSNLRCSSWYCPDCAPPKQAAWSAALNKYGWRTVLYVTMRPEFGDWRSAEHVDRLFKSFGRARRKVKHLRSLCPACRSIWKVNAECEAKDHHGAEASECRRCWVRTARKQRDCPDCTRGQAAGCFGYALVPEWNTHKLGGRGRLHANLLSDIAWGEFTRPELSAILEWAGFGWSARMVDIVNISHALKSVSVRELEERMHGRHGARMSVSEAVRYGIKDLADGASHQGALGRYPKHRRRISSNVAKLDKPPPDPSSIYSLLRNARDLSEFLDERRANALVEAVEADKPGCWFCEYEAIAAGELCWFCASRSRARGGLCVRQRSTRARSAKYYLNCN